MAEYDPNNPFAKILSGELPSHKVYEDAKVLAFMDIMPRADGHILVIPKARARNILDATPEDLGYLVGVVQTLAKAVKKAMKCDGLTVQQFNEEAGGQVVFHLHFHIVPRMAGVPLRPQTGEMEKPDVLNANAEKIRAAIGA